MFVRSLFVLVSAFAVLQPARAAAQDQPTTATSAASPWHFMQDAALIGMFNHQGGRRGGDEFRVPNWWMGMFSRKVSSSDLTINTMLSLDPLTVGKKGYRELFQIGETLEGQPLVDRQHPHDVFMQLAVIWRVPVGSRTGLTIAGAPSGEPAIGPIAFMHRPSAVLNPMAPLSHHTFDSTHISFGVVTAAIDRGPWMVEGSLFNGREPDEDRWDFDFGPLDSFAGRVWYRPAPEWEFQVSSARLREPEALEQGDITRTTGSGAWLRRSASDFLAATVAIGHNAKDHDDQSSVLAELSGKRGRHGAYTRLEAHQVETAKLSPSAPHDRIDTVVAFTLGGVRDLVTTRGINATAGAGVTMYGVPEILTGTHGARPLSFQIFLRIQPAGPGGKMWNMHMVRPMMPADPHAGHVMH
jgi:hypothetical protein